MWTLIVFHSTGSGTSNTISAEHKKLMGVNVNGGRRVGQWGSLGWDTRDPELLELTLTHIMFRRIQFGAVHCIARTCICKALFETP